MRKDRLRLWRDGGVFGKLELLSAQCFQHRYPAHSHDEFVIAAFRRGAQRHQIVRHTGIAYAGTVMIIPPGAVHTGEAAERDGGWEYCAFYPEASVLERIADEWLGPGTGILDFGRDVTFEDRVMTEHLLNAHRIAEISPDPIERQCVLFDAFGLLIRRYGQRTRERRISPVLDANIGPAIEFLREHFDRPLIVREIARVVDFSEFHFMRLFRAKTGLTVHAYLTQLRLHRERPVAAGHTPRRYRARGRIFRPKSYDQQVPGAFRRDAGEFRVRMQVNQRMRAFRKFTSPSISAFELRPAYRDIGGSACRIARAVGWFELNWRWRR